jgi:hypothetical protein
MTAAYRLMGKRDHGLAAFPKMALDAADSRIAALRHARLVEAGTDFDRRSQLKQQLDFCSDAFTSRMQSMVRPA